jgi:2-dehydropantoate 2-reductase
LSILDDLPSGFGPAVRALTFFGANVQQGQLLVHGDPEFLLAGAPDRGVAIDAAAETLGSAGISIRRAGSVEEAEWVKLPINLTVNLLATLADRPNRALVESPAMWEAAQRILGEFTELSRRSGRAIPERLDELLRNALAQHGENINSTLAAVRRGEKTELPWIVGRVIELGARVGVELPVIKTLYALVEARSSR